MQGKLISALLIALSAMLLSTSALANVLGPLDNVLIKGKTDGWIGSVEGSTYFLENPAENGGIRYFYGPFEEGTGGKRQLSVDVDVSNTTPDGRAGLLYGYQQNPTVYFMVLIGRGGQVEIYRRDNNGVNLMMSSSVDIRAGFNRVEVKEDGANATFFVNGNSIGSIESGATGKGSLGIAAMGIGRFGFANYSERQAGGWFN